MEASIINLNKVIETKEFLVNQILYRTSNGKTNYQYEQMENKLNTLSFKTLDKRLTKLAGDWRKLYNINI